MRGNHHAHRAGLRGAGALVACKAGRALPVQRLAVTSLRAMVQEMLLNPSYRAQAQRLQRENQAAGGVATAADLVERATRHRETSLG
jgi:UDP:flavonoid glycosyltransferase YjiC (YdhE family)